MNASTVELAAHSSVDREIEDAEKNDADADDIWSAAFEEALSSLGEAIDVAVLKGKSIEQLFEHLEKTDREASQDSYFRRGIKFLHSLQVPLENFKIALDLASPLTSLDPTVRIVFNVITGVTAVSAPGFPLSAPGCMEGSYLLTQK